MKKIVSISLFVLLFMSQVGYYFFYSLWQYHIKEQMEEQLIAGMADSALEVIEVDENNSSIIWQEEGKEFLLDNQLYDVARIRKVNGKLIIHCLSDKKEEELLINLSKAVKSGNENSTEKGKYTIKFLLNFFVIDHSEELSDNRRTPLPEYINFADTLSSSPQEVNIPPPRV